MDRLLTMEIFVTVVEEGGFSQAARKLKISPPVITRAIGELEKLMGIRLLTRTTRIVRVTDAGMRYAADCRSILADVKEAQEAASGIHMSPRGHLVVTASVLFGKMFINPIVSQYLHHYPDITVECRYMDRVAHLIEEGIDVGVRIGKLSDTSYQAVEVGHVHQVVCTSPTYLKQHTEIISIEALSQLDIVSASGVTPSNEWVFVDKGRQKTVCVSPRLTTITNDAAIDAVIAGFGVTRLMSYMVADHIAKGSLVPVLTKFAPSPLPIHVVHHEGRQAMRKVRTFIDMTVEQLRSYKALY